VLAERLGAVDVQRLGKRVSRLSVEDFWSVDEALTTILGMD
jgi:mRNA-degrading endonuclease toxin of MazEF toxin-antitoxin module